MYLKKKTCVQFSATRWNSFLPSDDEPGGGKGEGEVTSVETVRQ